MRFLWLLLLFPLLAAASQKVTIALDWYLNPDHATLLVAQAKGYFKQQHLTVKFLSPISANEPLKMVVTGQADAAISYEPTWIAAQKQGMKLNWLATLVGQPLEVITTLKSNHINQLSDLENKRMGSSSSATGHVIVTAMLKHVGLKPSDLHFINVQMNLMQALLAGRVEAVSGLDRNVEAVELEQAGHPVKLFKPENYGVPSYAELIMVMKPGYWSQTKAAHFRKALTQATSYLQKHPQQAWKLVEKRYHSSLAATVKMAQLNHAIWNATVPLLDATPGVFDQKQYHRFKEFLKVSATGAFSHSAI